jgi:rSAM/selenodomain-associated transferase 2
LTTYSVIIPAFNEAQRIEATILSVPRIHPPAEIILVDGGSVDGTVERASAMGVEIVRSKRGRGTQCNAGSQKATGEILLFLHADSLLPPDTFLMLNDHFQDPHIHVGTFRLQFDNPHWLLRAYAVFTRFDSMFTRYGDQCIVVRRSFFDRLGGFPDWPLFEDVHFLMAARRLTKIASFPAAVVTSARRYMRLGILRTQWINVRLFARFLLKTPPEKLATIYSNYGEKNPDPLLQPTEWDAKACESPDRAT